MHPLAFVLWVKYWLWIIVTKLTMGVIYVQVIGEGLRMLVPALGQRLYKFPGMSFLADYEDLHRLDIAPFMALFVLIAVFWLWERILTLWLSSDDGINLENESILLMVLGTVILGADAMLFYTALANLGWGGTSFSFSALLATASYVAILVFQAYVTVSMRLAMKG